MFVENASQVQFEHPCAIDPARNRKGTHKNRGAFKKFVDLAMNLIRI
jgi:hypothetical protein